MKNATKSKIYGGLAKAEQAINKASIAVVTAVSAVGAAGITASAESGVTAPTVTTPTVDLSGVDFSGLTASITSMVPQVLPVAVTVLGIRKAISFMMSTIRGC